MYHLSSENSAMTKSVFIVYLDAKWDFSYYLEIDN